MPKRVAKPAVLTGELTPFKSLFIARTEKPLKPDALAKGILRQVQDLAKGKWLNSMAAIAGPFEYPTLQAAFFTYVEERPPGWARGSDVRDRLNHVVVVCRGKANAKNLLAFFFSDNAVRDRVAGRISRKEGALGQLEAIPPATMNAAYVRGQAITLWMSGTHRRVATKVDNKVISGLDLQYALDPLEDQSFFFTAVRSRLSDSKLDQPVGSAPRRSRLWLGPSHNWDDFSKTVSVLFERIVGATKPLANPLPVLAAPLLRPADLAAIRDAYDVALIPPELLDPSAASPETLEERERLTSVAFEPFAQHGANFSVRVQRPAGMAIGTLDLVFDIRSNGHASWTVENEVGNGADDDLFAQAADALKNRRTWLKAWYDSGHTLADQAFFEVRFRDQPFPNFSWVALTGIDITKEKPAPVSAATIGAQDSLFCWVKNSWTVPGSDVPPGRGWLACDDGSMEKADFLHIDTIKGLPTLSLIHVKGSKSASPDRPISVSDYEVVTSQAVKNLRWVDQATLSGGLAGQLAGRIGDKVWHDGHQTTAAEFLNAVRGLGANYVRNIVILQPRARKSAVRAARETPPNGAAHQRLLQLDALLLGARANVVGLNANLFVIGEDG